MVISKSYRSKRNRLLARNLRTLGYFQATVYLEVARHFNEGGADLKILDPTLQVHVFGEFTHPHPWKVKVACSYDETFKCFKATIGIKVGQQFKFVINHG
jgi:hypothetical protein